MYKSKNKIVYITIIGEQNEKLFNRSFGDVDESEMELSAFASIDIIQEHLSQQVSDSFSASDPFLGFISPTLIGLDFYKVYAYVAATCIKIIAIISDNEMPPSRIRDLFENIHELYSSAICNPLLFRELDSPKFLNKIEVSMVVEHLIETPLDFVEGIKNILNICLKININ